MSAAAASARLVSRPTMPTRAPSAASPMAVALPMPPVPPVTRTALPAIVPAIGPRRASADDLELEGRDPQGAVQPRPDGQQALGAAGGAEVAQVDDVGVPEG